MWLNKLSPEKKLITLCDSTIEDKTNKMMEAGIDRLFWKSEINKK